MSIAEAEAGDVQLESEQLVGRWADARQRLLRNPGAVAGIVLILAVRAGRGARSAAGPVRPGGAGPLHHPAGVYPGPSAEHLLGVDQLGRDILSRIIYGARSSLLIGVVSLGFGRRSA